MVKTNTIADTKTNSKTCTKTVRQTHKQAGKQGASNPMCTHENTVVFIIPNGEAICMYTMQVVMHAVHAAAATARITDINCVATVVQG